VLKVLKTLVPLMLILAAPSLSAQSRNAQDPSELNQSEMVRIVTSGGRRTNCLAPLAVNRVDGEMVVVPAQGFLIEPGFHTINGQATLNFSKCPHDLSDLQMGSVADLEVDFVNGFTYYVGFDYKSDNTAQWQLVVWKMEPGDSAQLP
jgi:hypothetical protein